MLKHVGDNVHKTDITKTSEWNKFGSSSTSTRTKALMKSDRIVDSFFFFFAFGFRTFDTDALGPISCRFVDSYNNMDNTGSTHLGISAGNRGHGCGRSWNWVEIGSDPMHRASIPDIILCPRAHEFDCINDMLYHSAKVRELPSSGSTTLQFLGQSQYSRFLALLDH